MIRYFKNKTTMQLHIYIHILQFKNRRKKYIEERIFKDYYMLQNNYKYKKNW